MRTFPILWSPRIRTSSYCSPNLLRGNKSYSTFTASAQPHLGNMADETFDGSRDSSNGRTSGVPPKKLPQYLTTIAATFGSIAMGCVLGYSSPASFQLQASNGTDSNSTIDCGGNLSLNLSEYDLSWFGSTVNLGALVGAPIGGLLIKNIGRKSTLIASVMPFAIGWILIYFANSFGLLIAGRVFTGFCCGIVSLTIPNYIGEIASPSIRGLLGSSIQLMVTIGILYVYVLGSVVCWQWLAICSLIPAVLCAFSMIFCSESPTYLLAQSRSEDARKSLVSLRGKDYDVTEELQVLQKQAMEDQQNDASIKDLTKGYVMKPLFISLSLMFFQQTSGINAILFNLTIIFESAKTDLSPSNSSILIALVQVVMTGVATLLMDRAGRKVLLIASAIAMCLSLGAMGTYFYLVEQGNPMADSLSWLPLASLIIFISFFSIGYGPIPWLMMGELFSSDVREMAASIATLFNWSMSFIVTLVFASIRAAINDSGVYWLFSALCALNAIFCILVVKETKGKTMEEITAMFGGEVKQSEEESYPSI